MHLLSENEGVDHTSWGELIMAAIYQRLSDMMQYLLGAVARVFSPDEHDYPSVGVQPFEGDPYEKNYPE